MNIYHGDLLNFLLNARPIELYPISLYLVSASALLICGVAFLLLVRAADPGRAWRAEK